MDKKTLNSLFFSGAPQTKKPRFSQNYQQYEYSQDQYYGQQQTSGYTYGDNAKTSYQGYKNPYGEIAAAYDISKEGTSSKDTTYEDGEYAEEEYSNGK